MENLCKRCGRVLRPGMKFCTGCGLPVQPEQTSLAQPLPHSEVPGPAPSAGGGAWKKILLISLFAVTLTAAGVLIYFGLSSSGLNRRYQKLREEISGCGIPVWSAAADEQAKKWDQTGAFSLSDRKEVVKAMTDIADRAAEDRKDLDRQSEILAGFRKELGGYSGAEAEEIRRQLDRWEAAVKAGDCSGAARLEAACAADMAELRNWSPSEPAVTEPPVTDWPETEPLTDSPELWTEEPAWTEEPQPQSEPPMTEAPEPPTTEPENVRLSMEVRQVDMHNYPEINLYVRIENPYSGAAPSDLNRESFFVERTDGFGRSTAKTVTSASMIDGQKGLNMVLVADASASMRGSRLGDAEDAMIGFLRNVRFSDGDRVELLSFGTCVNLLRGFTSNKDQLIRDVQSISPEQNSCLYNALYMAVCRAACQPGPGCVIAFTDGENTYSSQNGVEEAKLLALIARYHIPVFIIGFDEARDSTLRTICSRSGGWYKSVSSASKLGSVFEEIYREEKELYQVRFTEGSAVSVSDSLNLTVEVDGGRYSGFCDFFGEIGTLHDARAGTYYYDGPEYAAEQFYHLYPSARYNQSLDPISDYILLNNESDTMSLCKQAKNLFAKDAKNSDIPVETLVESLEYEKTVYQDENHCKIWFHEVYFVQGPTQMQFASQRGCYHMEKTGQGWKLAAYDGGLNMSGPFNVELIHR